MNAKQEKAVFSKSNLWKLFWAIALGAVYVYCTHHYHKWSVPSLAIFICLRGLWEYQRAIKSDIVDMSIHAPTHRFARWQWIMLGSISFGVLGLHDRGNLLVFLLSAVTLGCDFGANVVGVLFRGKISRLIVRMLGRTYKPPFPESEKKTWEGTVGGIIITVPLCILVTAYYNVDNIPWYAYLLATPFGVRAVQGDLMGSRVKRQRGIKDFSKLMPGHGGVLDRFDALLHTSPWFLMLVLAVLITISLMTH